jgi:hypothetical protein
MAERDRSELDLAAAFRAYVEDAPTGVRPTELARHFATTYPHRRGLVGRWGFRLTPAMAWTLLLLGLLFALAMGSLAVGALRADRAVVAPDQTQATLVPAAIEVLPPGPIEYTRVVATSGDELWATSGWVVWHFKDGAWTSEMVYPGSWGYPTLAPDGTLWAAGPEGVAHRRDGRWVVVDAHPASLVAIDREGTVWVAGTRPDRYIWRLQRSGSTWTRTSTECPFDFGGGYVTSMRVDGRGALWVGAQGFVVNALARCDDGQPETLARAGLPKDIGVQVLGVSATGDVWIDFQDASTGTHARARFDGTTWTVVSGAADMAVAVAPDGAMWASAIARCDWERWEGLSMDIAPPFAALVVAPDGTVFAADAVRRLVRLPAVSPSP